MKTTLTHDAPSMLTANRMPSARGAALAAGLALALLLAGCATGPNANPRDPFEPLNREVSKFNDGIDAVLLKPVATVYKQITPAPIRTGVANFFGNLRDVWSGVNSLLQLKIQNAAENFLRFGVNTVFGFAGVLDVAGEMNIERHKEDFGQTLGRWGVPTGPYLVLPILGPSTLRDTAALSADFRGDLVTQIDHIPTRNSLYALRAVEARSNLLRASSVLDDAALDKYSFTRDVFLQLRRAELFDGAPPDEDVKRPPFPKVSISVTDPAKEGASGPRAVEVKVTTPDAGASAAEPASSASSAASAASDVTPAASANAAAVPASAPTSAAK